jgi:hypothetical protein
VKYGLALVPLFDMFNHTEGENTTLFAGTEEMEIAANNDYKANQQLKIFYGPRPNLELLLYQGFVYDRNRYNYMEIIFYPLPQTDKLLQLKDELLRTVRQSATEPTVFQLRAEGKLDPSLLVYLRVCLLTTQDELDKAKQMLKGGGVISEANELRAHKMLQLKLQQMLTKYPTTLEQDEQALKVEKNYHKRLALHYLIMEKKILKHNVQAVEISEQKFKNKQAKKQQPAK